jgi:hypothetical protein
MGGASLGLAVLTKPASLINVPVLAAYLILVNRDKPKRVCLGHLLAFALPLTIGVVGMMGYNWWRFESVLDTGYRNMGWTSPLLEGLYGLVASPGKGYLLYNPITLGALLGAPALWRQHKPESWVIIGLLTLNLVFLGKYSHWHGGGGWGPRLLLPVTPFVILPLGSLLNNVRHRSYRNHILAVLIAFSVVVQIPGVSVGYARFMQEVYDQSVDQYYQRIIYELPYSPLIGQWFEMLEVVGNLRDPASRAVISQLAFQEDADMSDGRSLEVLSTNLPDFWFVYLHFVREGS